jgi:hypothetical protein
MQPTPGHQVGYKADDDSQYGQHPPIMPYSWQTLAMEQRIEFLRSTAAVSARFDDSSQLKRKPARRAIDIARLEDAL